MLDYKDRTLLVFFNDSCFSYKTWLKLSRDGEFDERGKHSKSVLRDHTNLKTFFFLIKEREKGPIFDSTQYSNRTTTFLFLFFSFVFGLIVASFPHLLYLLLLVLFIAFVTLTVLILLLIYLPHFRLLILTCGLDGGNLWTEHVVFVLSLFIFSSNWVSFDKRD